MYSHRTATSWKENVRMYYFSRKFRSPGRVVQLQGALSHTPKGCGFSPVLGCVWEATDGCFPLTWMFLSLSLKLVNISSGEH